MRRYWKILVFAVALPLVVIGGGAAVVAMRLRPKPDPPRTAEVKRGDVVVGVRETGIMEPIKRVEVKSKVAGKLVELAVEEGDRVEEGQLIARLDVPELEAQRDQVKAQLDASRARLKQARLSHALNAELLESQLKQAESNLRVAQSGLKDADTRHRDAKRVYDENRRLFDMGGYVSQNEVDSAKAALDLAAQGLESAKERIEEQKAGVAIAKARGAEVEMGRSRVVEAEASCRQIEDSLTEIESRLGDAVIRAPCDGVVIVRHVREGEMVTAVSYYGAGAPLVTIGDLSTMLVKVNLNEVDVGKIQLGQKVDVSADALPDRTFEGRVTRISPASASPDPGSAIVRFPIEITVAGDASDLKPGMTANAEIACERVDDVLWVPNDALFQKDDDDDAKGKWFVAVVTGEEKKGKSFAAAAASKGKQKLITEDREVTKGLVSDSRVEITSGLKEGEKLELGKAGIPERKTIDIRRESEMKEEEES